MAIIGVVTPHIAGKITHKIKDDLKYFFYLNILAAILIAMLFLSKSIIFAVIVYLIVMSRYELHEPIANSFIHKHIQSKNRATVASFISLMAQIGFIIGDSVLALFGDGLGPKNMLGIASLFIFLATIVLLRAMFMNKNRKTSP